MATLGDLCQFRRGLTYKKSDEVASSRNAILRANNITVETGEINLSDIRFIRDEIEIPNSKKVARNCLLVCTASGSKNHLGKIALIEDDLSYAFGGFMGLLVPSNTVLPKYLFWLTRSHLYKDFISDLSDGININNLKWSQLSQFTVTLPPLPEQKRIVAILDEAFAGIATAVANTEKNLANARELFESYLNNVFTQKGEGWVEKRLCDVCDFQGGSQPPKSTFVSKPKPGYVRLLQIRDFKSDNKAVYIAENQAKKRCKDEDVMIGRYGASVGQIHRGKSGAYNVALMKTIPDVTRLDRDYLYFYLLSPLFQDSLSTVAARSAQAGFSKSDIKDFLLPLPPLSEQQRIASRLNALSSETQRLESLYQHKLTTLAELKQSLLHKAFSGALTAQPERALQEAVA